MLLWMLLFYSFLWLSSIPLYAFQMYHISFIHSSISGHLSGFPALAIVNSAAMNIGVHVSFWVKSFICIYSQEWNCWCVRACSVNSFVSDSCAPRTVAPRASLSMGFPRQACWSGLPCPLPGDLPDPGIKPASPALQVNSLLLSHWGSPGIAGPYRNSF